MNRVFRKQKSRKASRLDSISPACLKVCAYQLAPIFPQILDLCKAPCCFKRATIIPIPKKPKVTGLSDYRPVALTSVVMKSLERLVLAYLKDITRPLLDPLQFAYSANRSVDDAVNVGLHCILQHLDKPGNYFPVVGSYLWTSARPSIPSCLIFSQTNWHSSLCPPPSVNGSPASWQTAASEANSHPELLPSALAPLRVAFSLHCSSPSTPMTALQRIPRSSFFSLQRTLQSSALSRRTETSLLTDRRLSSWLSGAVLTTWS